MSRIRSPRYKIVKLCLCSCTRIDLRFNALEGWARLFLSYNELHEEQTRGAASTALAGASSD